MQMKNRMKVIQKRYSETPNNIWFFLLIAGTTLGIGIFSFQSGGGYDAYYVFFTKKITNCPAVGAYVFTANCLVRLAFFIRHNGFNNMGNNGSSYTPHWWKMVVRYYISSINLGNMVRPNRMDDNYWYGVSYSCLDSTSKCNFDVEKRQKISPISVI